MKPSPDSQYRSIVNRGIGCHARPIFREKEDKNTFVIPRRIVRSSKFGIKFERNSIYTTFPLHTYRDFFKAIPIYFEDKFKIFKICFVKIVVPVIIFALQQFPPSIN